MACLAEVAFEFCSLLQLLNCLLLRSQGKLGKELPSGTREIARVPYILGFCLHRRNSFWVTKWRVFHATTTAYCSGQFNLPGYSKVRNSGLRFLYLWNGGKKIAALDLNIIIWKEFWTGDKNSKLQMKAQPYLCGTVENLHVHTPRHTTDPAHNGPSTQRTPAHESHLAGSHKPSVNSSRKREWGRWGPLTFAFCSLRLLDHLLCDYFLIKK